MKTTLDLPRPLLLRIAARAARMRVPVSRFVAESLERVIPKDHTPPPRSAAETNDDPLYEAFRDELGL